MTRTVQAGDGPVNRHASASPSRAYDRQLGRGDGEGGRGEGHCQDRAKRGRLARIVYPEGKRANAIAPGYRGEQYRFSFSNLSEISFSVTSHSGSRLAPALEGAGLGLSPPIRIRKLCWPVSVNASTPCGGRKSKHCASPLRENGTVRSYWFRPDRIPPSLSPSRYHRHPSSAVVNQLGTNFDPVRSSGEAAAGLP